MRTPRSKQDSKIRWATAQDARALYAAHMRSIREICASDYTAEQIAGWSSRPFVPGLWERFIEEDSVWVVEGVDGLVLGFAHLRQRSADRAELMGLFLVSEVLGQGYGARLMQKLIEETSRQGCAVLHLESTRTAHGVYRRHGFRETGPLFETRVAEVEIEVLPMALDLTETAPR